MAMRAVKAALVPQIYGAQESTPDAALPDGSRIVKLALRVEKGNLTGAIRVCGTEGTGTPGYPRTKG